MALCVLPASGQSATCGCCYCLCCWHDFLRHALPDVALQMRYRNNSNYKNDTEIRKKAFVSPAVLDELKRIIADAEVRLHQLRALNTTTKHSPPSMHTTLALWPLSAGLPCGQWCWLRSVVLV